MSFKTDVERIYYILVSLQLAEIEELTEIEQQSARQMEPDILMLDKYNSELNDINMNISELQSKLRGVG